nr:E6 [Kittiwake papillomavirus 1]QBR99526.1 E6 [Kittiwake papillomavirus 1]
MPIYCTLGQVLQQTRKDLSAVCIYCRLCRKQLTDLEILDVELTTREDRWGRNIHPFQGFRTATGHRWFSYCGRCRRYLTHA